jgi:hypothetical protein
MANKIIACQQNKTAVRVNDKKHPKSNSFDNHGHLFRVRSLFSAILHHQFTIQAFNIYQQVFLPSQFLATLHTQNGVQESRGVEQ